MSRGWSWILLLIGFLAYLVNNILADSKPKKFELLLLVCMCLSLFYSVFYIFELVTQNEYKIHKLLLLQLPFPSLIIFGLFIYRLRPSKVKIDFDKPNVHF